MPDERRGSRAPALNKPPESAARRKAVLWSVLAGAAQLAFIALAPAPGPPLAGILIAIGYAFILPAVAVLHAQATVHRQSGSILASLAGTAAVTVGIGASTSADLRPAALVLLGIWWWTLGKMAIETGMLPRAFGLATAALGALSIGVALLWPDLFGVVRVALGLWLLALATIFARRER